MAKERTNDGERERERPIKSTKLSKMCVLPIAKLPTDKAEQLVCPRR